MANEDTAMPMRTMRCFMSPATARIPVLFGVARFVPTMSHSVMRLAVITLAACSAPALPRSADVDAIAARFVDAFANTTPLLTDDGRVVFVSDRDGLPQLYVARSDAPPV